MKNKSYINNGNLSTIERLGLVMKYEYIKKGLEKKIDEENKKILYKAIRDCIMVSILGTLLVGFIIYRLLKFDGSIDIQVSIYEFLTENMFFFFAMFCIGSLLPIWICINNNDDRKTNTMLSFHIFYFRIIKNKNVDYKNQLKNWRDTINTIIK